MSRTNEIRIPLWQQLVHAKSAVHVYELRIAEWKEKGYELTFEEEQLAMWKEDVERLASAYEERIKSVQYTAGGMEQPIDYAG